MSIVGERDNAANNISTGFIFFGKKRMWSLGIAMTLFVVTSAQGIIVLRYWYHDAQKTNTSNELCEISTALAVFAERNNGHLPPTINRSAEGRPLSSWRQTLLNIVFGLKNPPELSVSWIAAPNRSAVSKTIEPLAHSNNRDVKYAVITGPDCPFGIRASAQ